MVKDYNVQETIKKDVPIAQTVNYIFDIILEVQEKQLKDFKVQAIMQDKSKHFDLVIIEFMTPLLSAISARFKCRLIGITSLGAYLNGHDALGNPSHPLLHSSFLYPFEGELNFLNRMYKTLYAVWYRYNYYYYYIIPKHNRAVKHIGKSIPYLSDVERDIIMFFNSENPVIHTMEANVPAVVRLSNMHIKKREPLPKDLQYELDNSPEGVIYFSLGTNVRWANISVTLREQIIEVFSKVPYKVIWKYEEAYLPGQPKNVIIRSWLPQQHVLAHPNIKVFVTQGGHQSIEEAVFYGVPLVGLPFFGDHFLNIKRMVTLGAALAVDPQSLSTEEFKAAILEVAENPMYRKRTREISRLSRDMPMTGLAKVMWWTEYVLRRNATYLRSAVLDLFWYQYLLFDLTGLMLVSVISINLILFGMRM